MHLADIVVAGDRGGSGKGRVLRYLVQIDMEVVLGDVSGPALPVAFATH